MRVFIKVTRSAQERDNIIIFTVHVLKNSSVHEGTFEDIKSQNTVWLDVVAPTEKELNQLQEVTGIAPQEFSEWLEGKKRPVTLDVLEYSVIVFRVPLSVSAERTTTEPCVMLVSKRKRDFITVHKHPYEATSQIFHYSDKHKKEIFEAGPTLLLYTFINEIIDAFYTLLDAIQDVIEKAERTIFDVQKSTSIMQRMFRVKETMIYCHKALAANREVVSSIEKEYVSFLDQKYLPKFRLLTSAITQLLELNSTYRDISSTVTEIYLTTVSNNLNITVKKITSWGAVILVPSLIAGIFGMNFTVFPLLHWHYGLLTSLILMAGSVLLLYWYFKKKDWI